jgi:hypothetical protein
MNPKTVGIVIFGMCISFCAIFLTLSYLAEGPPPRDRELGRRPGWRPPSIDGRQTRSQPARITPGSSPGAGQRSARTPRGPQITGRTASPDAKRPRSLEPLERKANLTASSASLDSTVAAASSLATQQIALLRKDLRLQMAALRKNRDSMLDDLANELTVMSPGLAAQEVRLLDDESAALVLARWPWTCGRPTPACSWRSQIRPAAT